MIQHSLVVTVSILLALIACGAKQDGKSTKSAAEALPVSIPEPEQPTPVAPKTYMCKIVVDAIVDAPAPMRGEPKRYSFEAPEGQSVDGVEDFNRFSVCCALSFKYQLSGDGQLEIALGGQSLASGTGFIPSTSDSLSGDGAKLLTDSNSLLMASCVLK